MSHGFLLSTFYPSVYEKLSWQVRPNKRQNRKSPSTLPIGGFFDFCTVFFKNVRKKEFLGSLLSISHGWEENDFTDL